MAEDAVTVAEALTRRFLLDHPRDAALRIEALPAESVAPVLARQPAEILALVWQFLIPTVAVSLLNRLPDDVARELLMAMPPNEAARILALLDEARQDHYLGLVDSDIQSELRRQLTYPADSAGRLMDTRVTVFRGTTTVGEALDVLRRAKSKSARSLFIVDQDNRLHAKVTIQNVAVADPDLPLEELAEPIVGTVNAMSSQREVADTLEKYKLVDLPIVDVEGVLMGVVYHAALLQTVQAEAIANIQTMVGASKDERALSKASFAVRKRLPWLQINLLTAFMAAAVVGLFEDTIARFTALAVLLPVVAGQSGNAGAQALAVTMRGLALREITTRQWPAVTFKEVSVGLMNGIAIAITCGIGVYVWSGSVGLVMVIAISMVLAMIAAGFAGAVVPIALTRLGQDPAQSSSIVLTTVTDIAGFFAFLGIATLLAGLL